MSLSGYNTRAVVALCRWAAATGVPLHLAATGADDPILRTAHASRVFVQRRTAALDLDQVATWIHQLCRQHGHEQLVIAPSTEYFNRFLLQHRPAIEAAGGIVPLVDEALYGQVSDKAAFATMCAAHGIAVPRAFEELPTQLPFVAKPRHYGASRSGQVKPYLVFSAAERERFLQREAVQDYLFQEFVEGRSLYLLAHIARDGEVTACAQENLLQQPAGGSIVLARADDFHRSAEAARYLQMLVGAGFHGLVMIEVRLCRDSGRAVMIEANPRMWGPLQFMLDQQVDPFTPLFAAHGVQVQAPAPGGRPPALPYYFWSGGLATGAGPCTFHGFSAADFVDDYARIALCDLYARDDTRELHHFELAHAR